MHAIIYPMDIARTIRSSRRRAGMTQRELAAAASVPQATVGRIEAGSVSPRADTVARLLHAAGYEVAVEPLLGIGVDRSLIRDRLRLTPAQRIRLAVDEAHAMPDIRIRP
jgi:predicted transcriptional regulator